MQKKNGRHDGVAKAKAAQELDWLFSDLNDAQREAVVQTDGPVLILAGAGSGKTRVLTYRIAHVLASGLAAPQEILAMTFTNKAAGEMRERVAKLVPDLVSGMWIGTFHSLFARLLRREGQRIGYPGNFAIYDDSDQTTLIKAILKEMNLDVKANPPRLLAHKISNAKNKMLSPRGLLESAEKPDDVLAAQ
ncbi:MAG: UvrD-helicase domain-containing protein, partial [Actinobacteria bacterium]|nr:UvrD-helicase domain-containing protein [Actinomycetota bacterium]